ncbi:MAG: 50S ribosomal protein L9 [Flavobacteriales bacterium]
MEIILKQDIKNLGLKDEIVKVRDGYGRNFLIPQGMAIVANASNRKMHEETLRQRAHKEEKLINDAKAAVEKLTTVKISVGAKAGESGKIFGSVTAIQLAEGLKKVGFDIDRKNITLNEEHIKSLGTYTAKVRIYKNIEAEFSFDVVEE